MEHPVLFPGLRGYGAVGEDDRRRDVRDGPVECGADGSVQGRAGFHAPHRGRWWDLVAMARAWVGTSGWRYPPWRGVFYPPGLPQRRELAHLAGLMNSVEINGSFYSLQRPESYRAWAAETPDDFVFAVKGSRYITHLKQLRDVRVPLANFLASGLLALGPKLGPLLWQLPPRLRFDAARIDEFLALLPRSTGAAAQLAGEHDERLDGRAETTTDADRPLRHALEVRHESFRDPAFVELLRAHDVALVVADTAGTFPHLEDVTAGFVYVRLHGDTELYTSGYSPEALDGWAALRAGVARGGVAGRRAHGGGAGRPDPARRVRLLRQRREGACPVRRDRARRAGRLRAGIRGTEIRCSPGAATRSRARRAARWTRRRRLCWPSGPASSRSPKG